MYNRFIIKTHHERLDLGVHSMGFGKEESHCIVRLGSAWRNAEICARTRMFHKIRIE